MNWLCREAVGHCGVAPTGLKLVGGPHWKPATKNVSPEAPGRPLAVPPSVLLPVWAVPQPVAPTPMSAPPMARPLRDRKRRRLVPHGREEGVPPRAGPVGSNSGWVIEVLSKERVVAVIEKGSAV